MNQEKFNKAIKNIRKISLSDADKKVLWERIQKRIDSEGGVQKENVRIPADGGRRSRTIVSPMALHQQLVPQRLLRKKRKNI